MSLRHTNGDENMAVHRKSHGPDYLRLLAFAGVFAFSEQIHSHSSLRDFAEGPPFSPPMNRWAKVRCPYGTARRPET